MREREYPEKRTDRSRGAEISLQSLLVTQEEKQKKKEELIEKLLCEHISQCGIARAARVSRNRVTDHKKKRTPSYRIGSCEDGKTSGCRNRQSAVIRGR